MGVHTIAALWRGLVVTAIVLGSAFFALADLSGLALDGYDDHHLHFVAFAGMTLLAVSACPRAPLSHLLIALGLMAGLTELLQFVPSAHREPDWSDFAFNILGIDCALVLAAWLRRILQGGSDAGTLVK